MFLKNKKDILLNIILCFLFSLLDIIFILVIYFRWDDVDILLLLFAIASYLLPQIAYYKIQYFDYKVSVFFNLIFACLATFLIAPSAVKYSDIGNYKDSLTIKKEFVPKSLLNLPYCFNNYNFTCIDKDMTNENQVAFNNLLIRLKKDDTYYLRAGMPIKYDFNLSNINISECNKKENTTCYENLDNNKTIEIKNYDIKFKDFKSNDNNKTIFKDFKIKESNILN
ncbi:hypothetical protein BB381_04455 [Campylobacter pinnipediorum subsp. caledonicus]|nr:hypothetical protein BB381_04455 [Campylobacter pinnipediorum subsp. caledonicus]